MDPKPPLAAETSRLEYIQHIRARCEDLRKSSFDDFGFDSPTTLQRFVRGSERTLDPPNIGELPDSTPRRWSYLTTDFSERCADVVQNLGDRYREISKTSLLEIGHKLRSTVTGNHQRSETMDQEDRVRRHLSRRRRPLDRPINPNHEPMTPFSVLCSTRSELSPIHGNALRGLGLVRTAAGQANSLKPADFESDAWQGKKKNRILETLQDIIRMVQVISGHALLIAASGGAYYMGSGISDPGGREFVHHLTSERGGIGGHIPDTSRTILTPLLFSAISTTSFSLTTYHYILIHQGRDRDLLLLVFIGAGAIAGSLAGLDGIEIIMRVVPWCAIAAFLLCAFVLPPRARKPLTPEAEAAKEVQKGTPDTMVEEKGAIMDDGGSGESKLRVGLETEMEGRELIRLV